MRTESNLLPSAMLHLTSPVLVRLSAPGWLTAARAAQNDQLPLRAIYEAVPAMWSSVPQPYGDASLFAPSFGMVSHPSCAGRVYERRPAVLTVCARPVLVGR